MKNLYNKPEIGVTKLIELDAIVASGILDSDTDLVQADEYEDRFEDYWTL